MVRSTHPLTEFIEEIYLPERETPLLRLRGQVFGKLMTKISGGRVAKIEEVLEYQKNLPFR
jgi:hypothetical protein